MLLVFLGPTGLFVAVAGWVALVGCATAFLADSARRTTGNGLPVGGVGTLGVAVVLLAVSG